MTYFGYFGIAFIIVHTISILFITKISLVKRLFLAGWIAMMVVGVPIIYNYLPFWAFSLLCLSGLGLYVFLLLFQNDPDVRRSRSSASRRQRKVQSEQAARRYLEETDQQVGEFSRSSTESTIPYETEQQTATILQEKDFQVHPVSEMGNADPIISAKQETTNRVYTHDSEALLQAQEQLADLYQEAIDAPVIDKMTDLAYTEFEMESEASESAPAEDKKTKAIKYALQIDAMLDDDDQTEIIIPKAQVVKGHALEHGLEIEPVAEPIDQNTISNHTQSFDNQTNPLDFERANATIEHEGHSIDEILLATNEEVPTHSNELETSEEFASEHHIATPSLEQFFATSGSTATESNNSQPISDISTTSLEQLFGTVSSEETKSSEFDTTSTSFDELYALEEHRVPMEEVIDGQSIDQQLIHSSETLTTHTDSESIVEHNAPTQLVQQEIELGNEQRTTASFAIEATDVADGIQTVAPAFQAESSTAKTEVESTIDQAAFELTPLDAETVEVIKVKIANDGPLSVEEQLDREFYFQFIMYEIKELVSLGMYQQTVDYLKEILIDSYDKNLRREALDLLEMVKIDMYDPKINERIKKEYQQIKERKIL